MGLYKKIINKVFQGFPFIYSDHAFTVDHFYLRFGYYPDLKNPKTFNEKLNYKKLHDRNPLLTITADKIAARGYVKGLIGSEYLPNIYRIYRDHKQFSLAELPDQFMLKASHGSKWVKVVWDKNKENEEELRHLCGKWLRSNYYKRSREWCYKNIRPGIVVEELLLENGLTPTEFKFFCIHGRSKLIQVHYQRFHDHTRNFFNEEGDLLEIPSTLKINPKITSLPENINEIRTIAERLSSAFDFVRVDLYYINQKIYFGEFTHYPWGGSFKFKSTDLDKVLGNYWKIPESY